MRTKKVPWSGWVIAAILVLLLLAACQSPIDDPYGAGQQAREIVDILIQDASEFMAGFCGAPQAAVLAALAALLLGRRLG
ncbi:MAG TPA: hypothetical protein PKM78_17195 [Anaerolineae bacterium]|nr:hypothetical protein [Anaerolineae bacterium]HNU05887.1 hypothetical protein [Anaerolineae bacterium]